MNPTHVAAILALAAVTYGCRISGLVVADRWRPRGRARAAFEAIPVAVLTAVIAPTLLVTGPAESLAGLAAIVAARRLSMLPTILIGVAAVIILRGGLG